MSWKTKKIYAIGVEIRNIFLNGLFAILPITITAGLFSFSLKLLQKWLAPLYLPQTLRTIPGAEIILLCIAIFMIGLFLHFFVVKSLTHWFEQLIFKLPLIRPVYSGIKQLVNALSGQDKLTFKHVVIVEFPRKNMYSLGFLTSELSQELAPKTEGVFLSVFIPTTPNPTTGFFIIVEKEDIKIIDLTRQEAMALIISGGIIQPERFVAPENSTEAK